MHRSRQCSSSLLEIGLAPPTRVESLVSSHAGWLHSGVATSVRSTRRVYFRSTTLTYCHPLKFKLWDDLNLQFQRITAWCLSVRRIKNHVPNVGFKNTRVPKAYVSDIRWAKSVVARSPNSGPTTQPQRAIGLYDALSTFHDDDFCETCLPMRKLSSIVTLLLCLSLG